MAGHTFVILIVSCEVGVGSANSRNGDSLKPVMFRLGRALGRRSHFQLRCCVAPR
jgi:hypothetical protein